MRKELTAPIRVKDLKSGVIIAVKMAGKWHRSIVRKVQSFEVEVYLVDYGRIEIISIKDVSIMPEAMLLFPALFVEILVSEEFFDMKSAKSVLEFFAVGKSIEISFRGSSNYERDYFGPF